MRGGEWYPESSGSRKFLFKSQNLGGVLNESRNFIFLCCFASRILEFLASRSWSLEFLFSSLGLEFSNKGLGISASLGFYHSPPLFMLSNNSCSFMQIMQSKIRRKACRCTQGLKESLKYMLFWLIVMALNKK